MSAPGLSTGLYPGNKPAFALLEMRWGTDGEMVVLLDDKEILRASWEFFDDFTLINSGEDYAFSQIAIFGTAR